MIDIKFKAKRLDNNEWVIGLIWLKKPNSDKIFISYFPDDDDNEDVVVIDKKTVGQYTGLKDKNGVEIYTGDLVRDSEGLIGYVVYLIQVAGFVVVLENSDYRLGHRHTGESYTIANNHEVIGNIYDNLELINS